MPKGNKSTVNYINHGEWSPQIRRATMHQNTQGDWTRIGDRVILTGYLLWSARDDELAVINLEIEGLPFTPRFNGTEAEVGQVGLISGLHLVKGGPTNNVHVKASPDGTALRIHYTIDLTSGVPHMQNAVLIDMNNTGEFSIALTYLTDDPA